jgi:hypothetical protein
MTEMDEGAIDNLIEIAGTIITLAEGLKLVEYAPPAPPEDDGDPGDED